MEQPPLLDASRVVTWAPAPPPLRMIMPEPAMLGQIIRATAAYLATSDDKASPEALLYAEKVNGFSCRTCEYVRPTNATHGLCQIMVGSVHLDQGCCSAWSADKKQLHLYKEPAEL